MEVLRLLELRFGNFEVWKLGKFKFTGFAKSNTPGNWGILELGNFGIVELRKSEK